MKENKNLIIRSSSAEFLIFEMQKKEKGIEVRFEDGDLLLTQKALGELYKTTGNNHLSSFDLISFLYFLASLVDTLTLVPSGKVTFCKFNFCICLVAFKA